MEEVLEEVVGVEEEWTGALGQEQWIVDYK